jgi:hypothetical protein
LSGGDERQTRHEDGDKGGFSNVHTSYRT